MTEFKEGVAISIGLILLYAIGRIDGVFIIKEWCKSMPYLIDAALVLVAILVS